METDLLGFVKGRIGSYDGPLSELARDAGVKTSWLHMFARGEIPNPGIQQVQRLADALIAKEAKPPEASGHEATA